MQVSILTSDPHHPVVPWLHRWQEEMTSRGHSVELCFDRSALSGGDVLFLVSCGHIVRESERRRYGATLVLHASDLPRGRGWSPHIWAIVAGAREITVCALEAAEKVDTGDVWSRVSFTLEGHELLPEINDRLFSAELTLMTSVIEAREALQPQAQRGEPGPYMRRRTPEDSRLDPDRTIAEQFDLLRVVDNARYPAFFDYRGERYILTIEKAPRPS
jgi:methionyl-tRNA formyltransferase